MAEAEEIITTDPDLEQEEKEEETEETDPEEQENEDEPESEEEEEESDEEPVVVPPKKVEVIDDGLAPVEGETPRERALRAELAKERTKNAGLMGKDIVKPNEPAKKQVSTKATEVLKKYKPEEINSLREVLPALAEEMGFVRKDELEATTYEEKANAEIANFVKDHPEYAPENDKDGLLWNQLKAEYQALYKPPANPADYRKIFERIHKDIMGIDTTGKKLPAVQAAKEKVKVASHAGPAASKSERREGVRSPATAPSIRRDMLKGFSEEELDEITG